MNIRWTKEEDEILVKYYPEFGYKECQKYIKRTESSIHGRAFYKGIKTSNYIINEELFIKIKNMMLFEEKNVVEISKELNIDKQTIYKYFERRNLKITDFYNSEKQFARLPKKNQGLLYVYKTYKNQANKRNLDFNLTIEELNKITSSNCSYCDSPPKTIAPRKTYTYIYNGIDRINNNIGYTLDNSCACCVSCNLMKYTSSENDFLSNIQKIYNFRIKNVNNY